MESTETKKEDEYKYQYQLFSSTSFKKDYKKFLNDKVKIAKIDDTIKQLRIGGVEQLPLKMKAHFLTGNTKVI